MPIDSEVQFKTFFNDWLKLNTLPPATVSGNVISTSPDISSLSMAPDSTRLVFCAFFVLNPNNTYEKKQIQSIIQDFFLENAIRGCSFFWAAAIPLCNKYCIGGFLFQNDNKGKVICQNIFCSELLYDDCQSKSREFYEKVQNRFSNANELLKKAKEFFITPETAFKEYIEDYFEKNDCLPVFDELEINLKQLIVLKSSYYNALKFYFGDKYCDALKALFWSEARRIGGTETSIKIRLGNYFSSGEYRRLNIFPIPEANFD